jgi:tetratricopeptide (TPR) repeat protein
MLSARCTVAFAVMLGFTVVPFVHGQMPGDTIPNAKAVLNEASQIAIRQDKHQGYWCDRALLDIANVQKRAGDHDGALHTITKCNYHYGRNAALNDLAKTMARAGQLKQAVTVMRQMGTDHLWRQELLDDGVTMGYLEHQLSKGHLKGARQPIDRLTTAVSRSKGLWKLAVAHAKAGNKATANSFFQLALSAATPIHDEYSRARALWEIADAQIEMGDVKAASSTIQQLSHQAESFKGGWAKVAALREAAVRAAKISDRTTANRLFDQAIDGRKDIKPPSPLPEANRIEALNMIAKAQAAVGYIDDALKTAYLIKHREDDFTPDGRREEAFYVIAVAQAKTGDIAAAVATARSIQYYVQYKTDVLVEVASLQMRRGELKESLVTAEQIANPSKKATAYLKVAIASAKAGDKKTARIIAGRIRLTHQHFLGSIDPMEFDYSKPRTWGIVYQASFNFTGASRRAADRRASEVAAGAMTLSQTLDQQYRQSYAIMFNDFQTGAIVRALARAHAASGDVSEALAWSRRIGSNEQIKTSEDWKAAISVESRINAIIGVAEGILDKRRGDNEE